MEEERGECISKQKVQVDPEMDVEVSRKHMWVVLLFNKINWLMRIVFMMSKIIKFYFWTVEELRVKLYLDIVTHMCPNISQLFW